MTYTSAEAAKLLRKLNDSYQALANKEELSCEFHAAVGEDIESVRPAYNYAATQAELDQLQRQIRQLKHALNVFNTTHTVPGFNMTIDEMLVYIPQLTRKREKLASMKSQLPKTRANSFRSTSNIIDYIYLNYDLNDVETDYERVTDELSRAQLALDAVNQTETFEFDLV